MVQFRFTLEAVDTVNKEIKRISEKCEFVVDADNTMPDRIAWVIRRGDTLVENYGGGVIATTEEYRKNRVTEAIYTSLLTGESQALIGLREPTENFVRVKCCVAFGSGFTENTPNRKLVLEWSDGVIDELKFSTAFLKNHKNEWLREKALSSTLSIGNYMRMKDKACVRDLTHLILPLVGSDKVGDYVEMSTTPDWYVKASLWELGASER